MTEILIVYTSLFGNTEKLAQSIREGAASVTDTNVTLRTADETTIDEVRRCDALNSWVARSHGNVGLENQKIH
jgi:flavodoxin